MFTPSKNGYTAKKTRKITQAQKKQSTAERKTAYLGSQQ